MVSSERLRHKMVTYVHRFDMTYAPRCFCGPRRHTASLKHMYGRPVAFHRLHRSNSTSRAFFVARALPAAS